MRTLAVVLVLLAACRDDAKPPAPKPVVAPHAPPTPSAKDIVARTVCDHYWKFSSASARPYPSMAECIAAETRERPCDADRAQACADFAKTLQPGVAGGLVANVDCAACLATNNDPSVQQAFAEQRAALERATLTIHSAVEHKGKWPADLAGEKTASSMLVKIDLEMTNYGYRIDPDDFVLMAGEESIGSSPYTERLTKAGKPVDWRDPAVVDDPDLRIVAYFAVAASRRGDMLLINYDGKLSAPFKLR